MAGIVGIGIDVCEVARFAEMARRSPGAVVKLLSEAERELSIESQAARFAAKEALAKALRAPAGLRWQDAEVVTDSAGAPQFEISGTVQARASELGISQILVSLSHDGGIATAMVVCEA